MKSPRSSTSCSTHPLHNKPSEALSRLVKGIHADMADYRHLHELLDVQFEAALRHQSSRLIEIAEKISELVNTLEQRRQERVALASMLTGSGQPVSMQGVVQLLTESSRPSLQACWQSLENQVRECKEANARNCRLLTDQHEMMQRILHREVDTYAPA